jgi:uncharacterized phage protein (TIGR01671 family)
MRDIKFRGKSTKSGKWYYGDLSNGVLTSGQRIGKSMYSIVDYCEVVMLSDNSLMNGSRNEADVDGKTIGQYTGFTDSKSNKEIYVGDILEISDGVSKRCYAVIKFDELYGMLKVHIPEFCIDDDLYKYATDLEYSHPICEVIGNIYDNPKLLEADK